LENDEVAKMKENEKKRAASKKKRESIIKIDLQNSTEDAPNN
jgi:hypothetical protein